MQKKLLFKVSGRKDDMHGLRFAASFFTDKDQISLTLFHVAHNPSMRLSEARGAREMAAAMRQKADIERGGAALLEQAGEFLVHKGFSPENIVSKFMFRHYGAAADLILEGADGEYDGVVLGHRGLGVLDALVGDSISRTLVELPQAIPLWICRWPEDGRKHVLACVDGSDESLRAVDHVGFMLAEQPGHEAHLLNIHNPAKQEPLESEDIIRRARDILLENGLKENRIREKVRRGSGCARIIAEEAAAGGFAAVAVGRTGADKPPLKKLFLGSVTLKLLKTLEKTALWVSH